MSSNVIRVTIGLVPYIHWRLPVFPSVTNALCRFSDLFFFFGAPSNPFIRKGATRPVNQHRISKYQLDIEVLSNLYIRMTYNVFKHLKDYADRFRHSILHSFAMSIPIPHFCFHCGYPILEIDCAANIKLAITEG